MISTIALSRRGFFYEKQFMAMRALKEWLISKKRSAGSGKKRMTPVMEPTLGDVREPDTQHLEKMRVLFKSGQDSHHEKFPDIFCSADDDAAIDLYLRGFLKPKNPFRTRRKYALAWFVDDALCGYLLYHLHKSSDIFLGRIDGCASLKTSLLIRSGA